MTATGARYVEPSVFTSTPSPLVVTRSTFVFWRILAPPSAARRAWAFTVRSAMHTPPSSWRKISASGSNRRAGHRSRTACGFRYSKRSPAASSAPAVSLPRVPPPTTIASKSWPTPPTLPSLDGLDPRRSDRRGRAGHPHGRRLPGRGVPQPDLEDSILPANGREHRVPVHGEERATR